VAGVGGDVARQMSQSCYLLSRCHSDFLDLRGFDRTGAGSCGGGLCREGRGSRACPRLRVKGLRLKARSQGGKGGLYATSVVDCWKKKNFVVVKGKITTRERGALEPSLRGGETFHGKRSGSRNAQPRCGI